MSIILIFAAIFLAISASVLAISGGEMILAAWRERHEVGLSPFITNVMMGLASVCVIAALASLIILAAGVS